MAGTTIAYSEITILDLIDTATYIYYSENESGSGATIAPTTTTKYIGIYSGPPVEGGQPNTPPIGTEWTKYVGEDGAPGEGVIVSSVDYDYAISKDGQNPPTTGWQLTVPSLSGGDYLWSRTSTTYSDGKTTIAYSVSYSGIDGTDANTYYIETNQEEILRFNQQDGVIFSPEFFTFNVYENPKQPTSENIKLSKEENSYSLEILTESGFKKISGAFLRFGYDIIDKDTNETILQYPDTVYFNVPLFFSTSFTDQENADIANILGNKSDHIFRFSYLKDEKTLALKVIQLRNGVSDEMAKLNLNAADITASIQSGKLKFNANGLTILNNNEPQFYADLNGNLHLRGTLEAVNGTFSGILSAATGSFSGSITAKNGTIGGLTISENVLYSGSSLENSSLKIYGNGEVYAQNITLGNNASIENQISLGNAYIKNPNNNAGIFLQAGNTSLSDTGLFKLGDIQAYGGSETESSYIKAGNDTSFWQINGDGTACFKEIIVDKATIKNSIMEIGTVQAVGSLMLFKDSWKIEEVNGSNFTLESSTDPVNLQIGDFITDGNSYYKVKTVNGKIITLESGALTLGQNITKIGSSNDFLMAILGDSSGEREYAVKNSLTISKIINSSSVTPLFQKTLVLGDLTSINSNYGTGLYAENVFLNGTLTTQIKDGEEITYAGINTLNGANSVIFGEEDTSKIVFWAGSEGTTAENIQKANFQVTEAGSIYANKGRFEGSLITDSIIKGASIHTAKIYGEDIEGNNVALKIFDATRGIQFINSEELNTIQLGIGSNGLYVGENNIFIDLTEGVRYFGQEAIYSNNSSTVFINPKFIGFDSNIDSIEPAWKIKSNSGFSFTNNETLIFEIKNETIRATQKANFEQNVVFGKNNSSGTLDYQKTSEGYYNLYVR